MDIWSDCQGEQHITPVAATLFRLVESQEQVATLSYVDTLEEQALLEELLEQSKPPLKNNLGAYHYLLSTPFRYPPLKWGSRFGATHEPSLFYGAETANTTLAESAYYRFLFWYSMHELGDSTPPIKPSIRSEHTLFSVPYQTEQGIQLQLPPFDAFEHRITHPKNYSETQLLGTSMREQGVSAFQYTSARDKNSGLCVGLFEASAFTQKNRRVCSNACVN